MGRVLALVGATAAGKSGLAVEVAPVVRAEIVAVDAFTVYRGMDVGTAKPSPQERAAVPHHMVDRLDPSQPCSVEWFQREARAAVDDIIRRGRTPLLVGGSGLYFRAVVDDLRFPPTDAAVRAELEERYAGDPAAGHAALAAVDPDAAARIEPGNLRRTVRALEVLAITGRRFSEWRRAWDTHRSIYDELRVFGVRVRREELYERIDARVDGMVGAGLVEECERLAQGPLSATARQAIGYAEVLQVLQGALSLEEAVERTKRRSRRYAARQLRWFERDPRVTWSGWEDVRRALLTSASP